MLMFSHPSPHLTRFERACTLARKVVCMCFVACGVALLDCGSAHAQGGVPLITVATDQSSLNLSNQFGIPAGTAINQAGDFAFVGNGNSALFFRAAGAPAARRLLQIGDEIPIPALAGSQITSFWPIVALNASKTLLFEVSFGMPDDGFQESLLTYDGVNYHIVASIGDTAPAPDSLPYINLAPGSINDEGDINFAASLSGKLGITFYIVPSGKTAVRIVSTGDPIPPTCTWCSTTGGNTGVPLGGFVTGTVVSSAVFVGGTLDVPPLNAKGQMLISLWGGLFIGSKDQPLYLVPLATSGFCGPPAAPTGGTITGGGIVSVSTFSLPLGAVLNNEGAVAFVDTTPTNTSTSAPTTSALCVAPLGSPAGPVVKSGDPAPAAFPGGTLGGPSLWAMNDSGDITFSTGVSTTGTTGTTVKFALMRYHSSGAPIDVVAYNGEVVPPPNGATFASPTVSLSNGIIVAGSPTILPATIPIPAFSSVSMANDGRVSFHVQLAPQGNAICQQLGTNLPVFVSRDGQNAPVAGGGTFDLSVADPTITLDSGSTFYSSFLTGGMADFGEFLGTASSIRSLVNTGDSLPSGSQVKFVGTAPKVAGTFVVFMAQPAGGRINLLETDISSGTGITTRIVSDGDIHVPGVPGQPSASSVAPDFFVNENGEVAFEIQSPLVGLLAGRGVISILGGNGNPAWLDLVSRGCRAIYEWSRATGISTKVVAPGDMPPSGNTPFSCVELNIEAPSPMNKSGQLAFSSPPSSPFFPIQCFLCDGPAPTPFENGVFLYNPAGAGTISEMAAASDTLLGQTQPTAFVPYLSVPVNSAGQVAFGAQIGTPGSGTPPGFQAFFLGEVGRTPQEVVASGGSVPNSNDTFVTPHFITGLDDSGNLTFTAGTSTAADGIFFAPAGGAIQTIALDGGPAPVPGGGAFALTSTFVFNGPSGVPTTEHQVLEGIAFANGESDVAFHAGVTGSTTDSGYFRKMNGSQNVLPVVLQGDAVPGGGTFGPIFLNGEFALGPDGALAFVNTFNTVAPLFKLGLFVARPDGSLLDVLSTGDTVPGGGTLGGLTMTHLAAGKAGQFAFLASINGGSARQAIFMTAIPAGTAATTTALSPLQGLALTHQSVTLTATVSSAAPGMPTGNITFFDNGISLGTGTLAAGQAALTTSSLVAGSNTLVAQYDGDTNFASGNSPALSETVAGFAAPPVTVTAGHNVVIPLTLYAPAGSNMSFTLSVSGLPLNTTFSFDMNPVTPGPTGTTVHLTLNTLANAKLPPAVPPSAPSPISLLRLVTVLSAVFVAGLIKFRRVPRLRSVFRLSLAVLALAVVLAGCGTIAGPASGPPGTPQGLAKITITGASGATTVTTLVDVTVQ